MSDLSRLAPHTQKVIADFFERYSILSLDISSTFGINDDRPISHITFRCLYDDKGKVHEYKVDFKLIEQYRDIVKLLKNVKAKPELAVTLGEEFADSDQGTAEMNIRAFFKFIDIRLNKAEQEEAVQSIAFTGNTFVLNRKTIFKVISNDGEGKLGINVLSSPSTKEGLMLSAHGLMDGLYSGMIKEYKEY